MPISHGHRPYEYNEFIPEMDASNLLHAVEVKQNMYDQNTKLLQARLDELSSLPLLRDVDKQYANQELSKLYKSIEENAHADFSNPNTVKSFFNMSKTLANDPILNQSVLSTKEFMNRKNTLDEIRKKNPSLLSPANVDDYMSDAMEWFDSGNPGEYLGTKNYSPHIDLSKKYAEIVKTLEPQIRQQIIDTGEAWDTYTIESLTKERLSQAFMSSLSADDANQLRIDANFNVKKLPVQEQYNALKTFYQRSIENNQAILNDPSASKQERQRAQLSIAADNEIIENMKKGDSSYITSLYRNSYMNNIVDGLGQAYEYNNIKQEREADPYSLATHQGYITRQNQINAANQLRQNQLLTAEYNGNVILDENGQPKRNEDGTLMRDTEFWNTKKTSFTNKGTSSSSSSPNEDFSILKPAEGAKKYEIEAMAKEEEALINIPAGQTITKTRSQLDDTFRGYLEGAVKFLTGDDSFDSDYNQDYEVRFESFKDPGSGKDVTKVTVVDKDFPWSKENLSFTLLELKDFYEAYENGETATQDRLDIATLSTEDLLEKRKTKK